MRKEPFFQEQPQAFDRIEFRRAWRQRLQRDVGRHFQIFCAVPSGLVQRHEHMLVRRYRLSELVEIDLHRLGRHLRHDEREGVVRSRLDGTEDVGERVALIGAPRRTLALGVPAMTDAPLLPDTGLILEEQADFLARMCITNRLQAFSEPP